MSSDLEPEIESVPVRPSKAPPATEAPVSDGSERAAEHNSDEAEPKSGDSAIAAATSVAPSSQPAGREQVSRQSGAPASSRRGVELMPPRTESSYDVSIVVPGLNEEESLPELAARIDKALKGSKTYELIFVDDGSTDSSWEVIESLNRENPNIKGVRLRANFGKAMALRAGFARAQAPILMMMDADLQDDPADIHKFFEAIEGGLDVVVGWKVNRLDPANRKIFSRIFNGTVGWVTGVKLHDMNCGYKAFRREVVDTLPIYGDLFRFIPVLANWRGFKVGEVPVTHHARQFGESRYGLERILRGFFDLLSVVFLTRYSRKPMHLFGLVGLLSSLLGGTICLFLTFRWFQGESIGQRPLLLLGVLLIVLGIQFFSLGLIGEFMTFQHERRHSSNYLPIREIVP